MKYTIDQLINGLKDAEKEYLLARSIYENSPITANWKDLLAKHKRVERVQSMIESSK